MKHQKKRISKIVDELMTYFYSMGSTDLSMNIKDEKKQYIIYMKSNFTKLKDTDVDRLVQRLNVPRQVEMEEYCWELAGECDIDTELTLVGMMTDKAEISLLDDTTLEMTLFRYK